MNKIEELHLDAINFESTFYDVAVKSAAITKDISIKFFRWMRENDTPEKAEQFANYTDENMYIEFLESLK